MLYQNVHTQEPETFERFAKSKPEAQTENAHLVPKVDIFEDEHGVCLFADLPGVTTDTLSLEVNNRTLQIEGVIALPAIQQATTSQGERLNLKYKRTFTLSRELDSNAVQAELKHGVLKLRIPKTDAYRPRKIEVKVG